ncbi:hypothetical protein BDN72DRAFT_845160 [Pluteus cervinus]|uniref:Uncharacterized protein n=1 Tax=Pluteus cervinus TaxID=181527 RepID=A0ACD3AK02_9AGAR|nr:hypothetical protein BDN72DRAFT_845160 [Pluteus cervinus]
MSSPRLPPEIEYIIFTDSLSLKDGESALNLLSVAKRVHTWLMPEMVRTVAIRTEPRHQSHPTRFNINILQTYGVHTRNLFLWLSSRHNQGFTPDQYLSWCPNITNLLLWTDIDEAQLKLLGNLPLTHLSIDLDDVPNRTPELTRVFSKITHLETLSAIHSDSDRDKLKDFSSLTHLAIPNESNWDILPTFFTNFPTLQVLIYLDGGSGDPMGLVDGFDPNLDDPRVVKLACKPGNEIKEWLLDIQTVEGMWDLAAKAVLERKKLKEAAQNKKV